MPYSNDDLNRFASYQNRPTERQQTPQTRRPPVKKKSKIKLAPILAVLLIISLIAGVFMMRASAEQKHKNEELSAQITQLNNDLNSTKAELEQFKETFGSAELPALNEDKSNYDEVVSAYDSQITGLVNKLSDLRSELNGVKEQNPNKPVSADPGTEANNGPKVCYLTFDDGPSANTLKILEILKKYNAKATFFVIGDSKLDYAKNIVDEGHTIALHTNTHDYAKVYSGVDAYFSDLQAISDKVYDKTGVRSKIIRFPGGSSNTISKKYCTGIMTELTKQVEERGYKYFDWDVDSGDASGNGIPAATLVSNIKKYDYSQMGNICVLCHDTEAKSTTVTALPEIIEHLAAQGYEFRGLTEDSPRFHHGVNN